MSSSRVLHVRSVAMVLLLNVLVLLLIGALVTVVVQKYVPLDGQVKTIIVAIVWLVILIALVQRLGLGL